MGTVGRNGGFSAQTDAVVGDVGVLGKIRLEAFARNDGNRLADQVRGTVRERTGRDAVSRDRVAFRGHAGRDDSAEIHNCLLEIEKISERQYKADFKIFNLFLLNKSHFNDIIRDTAI